MTERVELVVIRDGETIERKVVMDNIPDGAGSDVLAATYNSILVQALRGWEFTKGTNQ